MNNELRNLLLKNCLDDNGDLVISDIDLSKFKGNVILKSWKVGGDVDLSFWEVKGNLYQNSQTVNGNLNQSCHIVKGDLDQSCQTAKNIYQGSQKAENLFQSHQNISKDLVSQKLEEDEEWVDYQGSERAVIRAKKLKEISLDELTKIGYKLKEKN